jgi:glutathione S-transferase
MQPIKIYMAPKGSGPNPWKPIFLLAELDLPYEIVWISYADTRSEPYTSLNPNGRLPAMIDPNSGITLWESGAIVEYLSATYDSELKLAYGDDRPQEKWLQHSWLMFQMSGQGPMFGQLTWFLHRHREKHLESVVERYKVQTRRVLEVIDTYLGKKVKERQESSGVSPDEPVWLVGDKCTFADIMFISWNICLYEFAFTNGELNAELEYPHFHRWDRNLLALPGVSRVVEEREAAIRTMTDTAQEVVIRQNGI